MATSYSPLSGGRRTFSYAGIALIAVGSLLFVTMLLTPRQEVAAPPTIVAESGGVSAVHVPEESSLLASKAARGALSGVLCILLGGIMVGVGRRNSRDKRFDLSSQKDNEELMPWNVTRGAVLEGLLRKREVATDTVERVSSNTAREVVKVRCSRCRALNDEDARFCKACGTSLE